MMSFFPGGTFRINSVAAANYASLPTGMRKGTLGVITALALGSAYALTAAPASPAAGDLWVLVGSQSLAPIQANQMITLYPRAVYQWTGSAWVLREAYVFTSSVWVQITLNLYDNGALFLATGFDKIIGDTLTLMSTRIYLFTQAGRGETAVVRGYFSNAIDLTGIHTVKIVLDWSGPSSEVSKVLRLEIGSNKTGTLAAYAQITAPGTNLTVSVDVSALSGFFYIGVYATSPAHLDSDYPSNTVQIQKCSLEK